MDGWGNGVGSDGSGDLYHFGIRLNQADAIEIQGKCTEKPDSFNLLPFLLRIIPGFCLDPQDGSDIVSMHGDVAYLYACENVQPFAENGVI
jgi:hypothetical protein